LTKTALPAKPADLLKGLIFVIISDQVKTNKHRIYRVHALPGIIYSSIKMTVLKEEVVKLAKMSRFYLLNKTRGM
jgi:hypothetical protein